MASEIVTATHLTTDDGTSAASFNTASISPSSGKLVIVAVANNRSGGGNQPTVSGCGITWTAVRTKTSGNYRLTMFEGRSFSPSSGVLTIDFGGQSQTNCLWTVSEFGNVPRSGTLVINSADNSGSSAGGIGITMPTFANVNNATHGVVYNDEVLTITKGSNFTELANNVQVHTIASEWARGNQATVDWTWSGTHFAIAMGIEIAAANLFKGAMI